MIIGITALCLFLFGGGGGLEFYLTNLKDPVKEHVQDKDRQEVILDASKALGKELTDIQKDVTAGFKAYVKAHADYESAPEDFDQVTDEMIANQLKLAKEVLDARDKMHEQMTADEWRAVFSKQ